MSDYDNTVTRLNAQALQNDDVIKEIFNGIIQESAVLSKFTRLRDMTNNQTRLRILDSLPAAYWVDGDTGLIKTTKQAWESKYIYAEKLAVIIPIPKAVSDDSEYDIFGEIKPRLIEAFGSTIDAAILFGTNAPASFPDDIVTGATSASKTQTFGASTDLADDINEVMALVEDSGYDVNGFVCDIGMKSKFRGLRDASGGLIFQQSLQSGMPSTLFGQPISYLRNGAFDTSAARVIAGDFTQAVYSIRKGIEFEVLREASIHDAAGDLVFNLAQQDMIALKAVMRMGWQLPNPINKQKESDESRYPFSLLIP